MFDIIPIVIGYFWSNREFSIAISRKKYGPRSRHKASKGYCITEGTEGTGCATNSVTLIRNIRTLARRRRRELHLLFYSKSHLYRATPDASVVLILPEITNTCLYATRIWRVTQYSTPIVFYNHAWWREESAWSSYTRSLNFTKLRVININVLYNLGTRM